MMTPVVETFWSIRHELISALDALILTNLIFNRKRYLNHTLYCFITKNQVLNNESVLPVGLSITDSHRYLTLKRSHLT